jgi:hypothetical protein
MIRTRTLNVGIRLIGFLNSGMKISDPLYKPIDGSHASGISPECAAYFEKLDALDALAETRKAALEEARAAWGALSVSEKRYLRRPNDPSFKDDPADHYPSLWAYLTRDWDKDENGEPILTVSPTHLPD